jgi:hypothetical protein
MTLLRQREGLIRPLYSFFDVGLMAAPHWPRNVPFHPYLGLFSVLFDALKHSFNRLIILFCKTCFDCSIL